MHEKLDPLLRRWYSMLGLAKHSPPSWYQDRFREELLEQQEAITRIDKLSETSDVFFASIRARYDGFAVREVPASFSARHALVFAYMLGKYTSRWQFYRTLAFLCGAPHPVYEVVNPGKDDKLGVVALRHQIDPAKFIRIGRRLRRVWPLFP